MLSIIAGSKNRREMPELSLLTISQGCLGQGPDVRQASVSQLRYIQGPPSESFVCFLPTRYTPYLT